MTENTEWTIATLKEHFETLRAADDRRYQEVNDERAKALKIKETADEVALGLARDIQKYKDEKANELRAQIESERGTYATKVEIKPIAEWVQAQQGKGQGFQTSWAIVVVVVTLILGAAVYFKP
jgi:hypothetical protein